MNRKLYRTLATSLLLIASLLILAPAIVNADFVTQVDDSTWIRHVGTGLSFRAPDNWLSLDDSRMDDATLTLARQTNPQIEATYWQAVNGDFDIYLVDLKTYGNINHVTVDMGMTVPLATVETTFLEQYPAAGLTIVASEHITLEALGEVLRLRILTPFTLGDGTNVQVEQFQYIILDGPTVHFVTMNVALSSFENHISLFEQIADTFTFDAEFADWVEHTSDVLVLSAPASWLPLDDPALTDEVVDELVAGNPQLLGTISQARSGQFDIYLIEPESSANLNLNVVAMPSVMTLSELDQTLRGVYPDMGVEILDSQILNLPLGEVLRLHVDVTLTQSDGTHAMREQYQYAIIDGLQAYVVTITSGNEPFADYLTTFDAIADSFALPDATLEPTATQVTGEDGEWVEFRSPSLILQAPPSWVNLKQTGELEEVMDQLAEYNPQMQSILETTQIDSFEIYLIDPVTTANLNYNNLDLGMRFTLETIDSMLREQYPTMGLNIVETEIIELPVGETLQIHLQTPVNLPGGMTIVAEQYQYVFMAGTIVHFVTMTAGTGEFSEYVPIFDQIAESFQLR